MFLEENKPLAPFTTFGIGGPARWFVEAALEDEIVEATVWARERGLKLFVLGGGSNLLVADAGFDGLVLRVGLLGSRPMRMGQPAMCSGSGCIALRQARIGSTACGGPSKTIARVWSAWQGFRERWVGRRCRCGAYGQEVANVVDRVRAFDLKERAFVELPAAECGFGYRRSRFNTTDRGRFLVTRVDYRLNLGGAPALRYAELQRAIEESARDGRQPGLAEVAAVVRRIRSAKGMLLVEGDADWRSAGSFFKNPVVSEEQAARIAATSRKDRRGFLPDRAQRTQAG